MRRSRSRLALFLTSAALAAAAWAAPTLGAQLLTQGHKAVPALVLVAFGTSTRAQVTYDVFEKQLREALPDVEVRWAFTSERIREKVNAKWASEGLAKRLRSLPQALADLEADGYRRVGVQPLHITPGEEYEEVREAIRGFPSLRIELGETLLHRWATLREVVSILARDFLPPEEGCNVLVAHGSPTTAAASNSTYLGLERHLRHAYPNVTVGCVEGILGEDETLAAAKAHTGKRVRFIPLLFVGGDHAMNDVMGDGESWRTAVVKAGKSVDMPMVEIAGEKQYRGLGLIPEVNRIIIREAQRVLQRL